MRFIMARLSSDFSANEKSSQILGDVKKNMGMVPNIFKILGNSSAVLSGYLAFSGALKQGTLSDQEREQIALAVAGFDHCEYCASAHSAFASKLGISENEAKKNLRGDSDSPRIASLIKFCLAVLQYKGSVSDEEVEHIRSEGFSDEAIVEIVANIAINIFTNYFNHVAETDLDFPKVSLE
jgi:uncharacterized peroxidase-related enzyme